jgi:hypothetical protein
MGSSIVDAGPRLAVALVALAVLAEVAVRPRPGRASVVAVATLTATGRLTGEPARSGSPRRPLPLVALAIVAGAVPVVGHLLDVPR